MDTTAVGGAVLAVQHFQTHPLVPGPDWALFWSMVHRRTAHLFLAIQAAEDYPNAVVLWPYSLPLASPRDMLYATYTSYVSPRNALTLLEVPDN